MTEDIKLPPLHYDEMPEYGDAIPAMYGYARRAIKADRQQRGGPVALTFGHKAVAAELLKCFEAWEPLVCVLGNVCAKDGADLMRAILNIAPQPAAPSQLCDCERGHNGMGIVGRECDCAAPAQGSRIPDGFRLVNEDELIELSDSILGNYYRGQDWERERITNILATTPKFGEEE